jgi:hypothetical protein
MAHGGFTKKAGAAAAAAVAAVGARSQRRGWSIAAEA